MLAMAEEARDERLDCERSGCPGRMVKRWERSNVVGGSGRDRPVERARVAYYECPVCGYDTRRVEGA